MANETTLVYTQDVPISFTVANTTGITKGAILKMTDPMTAIINSGADDVLAGIAYADKIASDGVTKLAVYRKGIFKILLSGSCNIGDPLGTDAAVNYVKRANLALSGSRILGHSLETGTTGESILVQVNIQNSANL